MAQVQREVLGTIELCKNELRGHLGTQFDEYWRQLKDFFVFKLSKKDLDAMVTNLCGAKLHLHNSLVRAIMRDAVAKAVHHPKNVAAAAAQTALAFKRIKSTSEAAASAAAAAAANASKNGVNGVGTSATPPKPKRRRPDSRRNPSTNASSVLSSAASSAPANSEKIPRPEKQGRRDRPQKDGGDKGGKSTSSRPSSAASASRKKETAAVATAAPASAAAVADGPRNRKKPSSSASAANSIKKVKEDPELERMQTAAKKADDEVDQSLRLQETVFREFTLIDGCDLNDSSAPLPHQLQIRRMMKRQVLECGIQDISKDAAKFVSDALDIYLQKLIQRMISTRGILRERKSSIINADLGFEREHIPHASAFACKNPQSLAQLQWAMWNSDVVLPSDMIMVFRQNPKMLGSNRQLSLEMLSAMPIHPYASKHQ